MESIGCLSAQGDNNRATAVHQRKLVVNTWKAKPRCAAFFSVTQEVLSPGQLCHGQLKQNGGILAAHIVCAGRRGGCLELGTGLDFGVSHAVSVRVCEVCRDICVLQENQEQDWTS